MWRSLFLVGLLSLLLLSGCASRFEKALDEVRTGDEAERRFGPEGVFLGHSRVDIAP